MTVETVGHTWSRRSFLTRVGLGTLSLASLSPLPRGSREERAVFYEQACRLIAEDAADIWVYNRVEYPPLAKTVQGFTFCPVGLGWDFWALYFDAQA